MMKKMICDLKEKSIIFTLVFSMLIGISAAGCTSSPENSQNDTLQEETSVAETSSQLVQAETTEEEETASVWRDACPERYVDEFSSGYFSCSFLADVIAAESNIISTYEIQREELTQDTVDHIISYLFKDREWYGVSYKSAFTRSRRSMGQLLRIENALSALASDESQYSSDPEKIESFRNKLAAWKDSCLDAIDMDTFSEEHNLSDAADSNIIHGLDVGLNGVAVISPTEYGYVDFLSVTDNDSYVNTLEKRVSYYSYLPDYDYTLSEDEMSFTRNQAIEKVKAILKDLQISHLTPVSVEYENGYYTVYLNSTNEWCEYPDYMTYYNSPVPLGVLGDNSLKYLSCEFMYMLGQDISYITLNEDHIQRIYLSLNDETPKIIAERNLDSVMNFSEMMEEYKTILQRTATKYYDTFTEEESVNLKITEIRLQNMYYFDANTETYISIPTWCFYGEFYKERYSEDRFEAEYIYNTTKPRLLGTFLADKEFDYSKLEINLDESYGYCTQIGSNAFMGSGLGTFLIQSNIAE